MKNLTMNSTVVDLLESHRDEVEALASLSGLSTDEVEARLDEIVAAEESARADAEAFANHEIPTGEGLARSEARRLLVDEMNFLIQHRNRRNIMLGLPMVKTLRYRAVEHAVSIARSKTGYEELLENAGFRPKKLTKSQRRRFTKAKRAGTLK